MIYILLLLIILSVILLVIFKNINNKNKDLKEYFTAINNPEYNTLKILYLIRSIPKYYDDRLKAQIDTWFQLIHPNDKILIASDYLNHQDKYGLNYSIPKCPRNHSEGPCCSESNGILKAFNELDFDWMFVVDDDVYVYPQMVREIIFKYKDKPYKSLGTPGCVSKNIIGFCGGGGYAISKQALGKLIGSDQNKFLNDYKTHCDITNFCDITTADLLKKKNIELIKIPEFKPWGIKKGQEQEIRDGKVATLHYYGGELTQHLPTIHDKMNYLHNIFKNFDNNIITTLITTSPIKSMYSIKIIKETIDSLKLVPLLYNNPVIICFDGGPYNNNNIDIKCASLNTKKDIELYETYKKKVKHYIKDKENFSFVELAERGCLTTNLKNGLKKVKTKYINVMQHDLKIIKSFDLIKVLNLINTRNVDLVRYVYNTNLWHQNYYRNECGKDLKDETFEFENQQFSYCNHFSDNNHITTLEFYNKNIIPKIKDNSFMEYYLTCSPRDHNFNFVFYGDMNDGNYITHIDGRNTK